MGDVFEAAERSRERDIVVLVRPLLHRLLVHPRPEDLLAALPSARLAKLAKDVDCFVVGEVLSEQREEEAELDLILGDLFCRQFRRGAGANSVQEGCSCSAIVERTPLTLDRWFEKLNKLARCSFF